MSQTEPEAEMPEDAFFTLRGRAYELAGTGRHKMWKQVAYALLAEGFDSALIKRLNDDKLAVMLITRNCRIGAGVSASTRSRFRKWFALLSSRPL